MLFITYYYTVTYTIIYLFLFQITSEMLKSNDYKDDVCTKKIENISVSKEIGSAIEALIKSDATDNEIKRNTDTYLVQQAGE